MQHPQITHMPCDLNQQRERHEARRDRFARSVALRNGHRSLLERLLRRHPRPSDISAEDARLTEAEDVHHALRF
jgi:hypothetical protein